MKGRSSPEVRQPIPRHDRAIMSAFRDSARFLFQQTELTDVDAYRAAFDRALAWCPPGITTAKIIVWHLAANSDILAGVRDPTVDLRDTYLTTFNTLRMMRERGLTRIAFASTSAIYGPLTGPLHEDAGPLFPISNYGAMKLRRRRRRSALPSKPSSTTRGSIGFPTWLVRSPHMASFTIF